MSFLQHLCLLHCVGADTTILWRRLIHLLQGHLANNSPWSLLYLLNHLRRGRLLHNSNCCRLLFILRHHLDNPGGRGLLHHLACGHLYDLYRRRLLYQLHLWLLLLLDYLVLLRRWLLNQLDLSWLLRLLLDDLRRGLLYHDLWRRLWLLHWHSHHRTHCLGLHHLRRRLGHLEGDHWTH